MIREHTIDNPIHGHDSTPLTINGEVAILQMGRKSPSLRRGRTLEQLQAYAAIKELADAGPDDLTRLLAWRAEFAADPEPSSLAAPQPARETSGGA